MRHSLFVPILKGRLNEVGTIYDTRLGMEMMVKSDVLALIDDVSTQVDSAEGDVATYDGIDLNLTKALAITTMAAEQNKSAKRLIKELLEQHPAVVAFLAERTKEEPLGLV